MLYVATEIDSKLPGHFTKEALKEEIYHVNRVALDLLVAGLTFKDNPNDMEKATFKVKREVRKHLRGTTLTVGFNRREPENFNPTADEMKAVGRIILKETEDSGIYVNRIRFAAYDNAYFANLSSLSHPLTDPSEAFQAIQGKLTGLPTISILASLHELQPLINDAFCDYLAIGEQAGRTLMSSLKPPSNFNQPLKVKIDTAYLADSEATFIIDFPRNTGQTLKRDVLRNLATAIKFSITKYSRIGPNPKNFTIWLRQGKPEVVTIQRD